MSASKDRKIVEMHAEIAELRQDLAAARALLREAAEEMRGQRQCESLVLDIDAALAGEKNNGLS